jgi:hypothetical protein
VQDIGLFTLSISCFFHISVSNFHLVRRDICFDGVGGSKPENLVKSGWQAEDWSKEVVLREISNEAISLCPMDALDGTGKEAKLDG